MSKLGGSLKGDYIKKELFVYVWNLFNFNCCIPPGWGWEEFQVVSVWNVEKLTTNVCKQMNASKLGGLYKVTTRQFVRIRIGSLHFSK